jgi:predicted Zn-dependent peptidase
VKVFAFLAALLVLPAGTRAADELSMPPVTRATFDNGLRTVVAEYHELPLVEFYLIVGAGAAQDPPGKEGLAALTAGALTRGAGERGAIALAEAIETLGGRIAASAGTDGTIVMGEFLAKDFDEGLGLLRDVLLDPTLARDEVRRGREEQEAGIVAALEDTSAVAEKCYAGFLYGPHPYGRPVEGRAATVAKLGRGDVENFYERWYRPNNTILVVVGDIEARRTVVRLREAFGAWRPDPAALPERAPPPARVTGRRVLLVDKADATQTQIRYGNISIARNDPDYVPATVANTILGGGFTSRLIEELRVKRSLTYAAWSQFAARLTGGDFRVSTFTKSPTTAETLGLALSVEGDFRSQPPARAALDKAKAYLRGQFPLRLESPDALATRLAEIEFYGLPQDELATYRSRVTAVTPEETQRVAAKHMPSPDDVAIVVVGKAAEIRDQLRTKFGDLQELPAERCEDLSLRTD